MITGLATRLVQARKAAGYSRSALARKTGVSLHQLNWIESGRTPNPGVDTIANIAQACEVRVDWLLGLAPPERLNERS